MKMSTANAILAFTGILATAANGAPVEGNNKATRLPGAPAIPFGDHKWNITEPGVSYASLTVPAASPTPSVVTKIGNYDCHGNVCFETTIISTVQPYTFPPLPTSMTCNDDGFCYGVGGSITAMSDAIAVATSCSDNEFGFCISTIRDDVATTLPDRVVTVTLEVTPSTTVAYPEESSAPIVG